jgi:hypothetical protein
MRTRLKCSPPTEASQGLGPGDRREQRLGLRAVRLPRQRLDLEIGLVAEGLGQNAGVWGLDLHSLASGTLAEICVICG